MKYGSNRYLTIDEFLNLKGVKDILGNEYILTDKQKHRLELVLEKYDYYRIVRCDLFKTISMMIKYDLINYVGRMERIIQIKERKQSFCTLYAYFLRYGKIKGKEFYLRDKERRINSLPSRVEYWVNKGYSEEEAAKKVSESNKEKSLKSAEIIRGKSEFSCRSIEYWLKKGMTYDQSKQEVKRVQGVGSLDNYIKRYGEEQGTLKWKERQIKWQDTLNSKSEEEKRLINMKKNHSIEAYMISRGVSYEEAEKLSIEFYKKRNNYSQISQKCFQMLEISGIYNGYYKVKNYERQINGCNVDYYEPSMKIVIEYNGDYWHCRKDLYEDNFVRYNLTAKEVREKDDNRMKKLLESDLVNGIIIIWDSMFRKNPSSCIEMIKNKMEIINGSNGKRIEEII